VELQHKELLVCESCGAVITTVEHLNYMHRKLGPKAFASILNLSVLNRRLKLAEGQELSASAGETPQRKDMFSVICQLPEKRNSQVSLQRCVINSATFCTFIKTVRSCSSYWQSAETG
jgi:hypothetical protein